MRTTRPFLMAMGLLLALAAGASRAAAQGTSRAHVRLEVLQPAIPLQTVRRAVALAAADPTPRPSRSLPAGAYLHQHDRSEAAISAGSVASPTQRPRTVRVITLAYTAN